MSKFPTNFSGMKLWHNSTYHLWYASIRMMCVCGNHFHCCTAFPLQAQLWKIRKQSCTAFWKLMCVWAQCSSKETFRFLEEAFCWVQLQTAYNIQIAIFSLLNPNHTLTKTNSFSGAKSILVGLYNGN